MMGELDALNLIHPPANPSSPPPFVVFTAVAIYPLTELALQTSLFSLRNQRTKKKKKRRRKKENKKRAKKITYWLGWRNRIKGVGNECEPTIDGGAAVRGHNDGGAAVCGRGRTRKRMNR
ncbi:unnamed protein product [Cuscuta europaea]|uniref:Uncharacterized protein n=1 Tax=Cuscuta europaea TaxID=41803 RepID=A0A9P0Z7C3_CUSEU|nr:unnamed protein product [Cuscuta europaea]